jgi:hypothetical protein
MKMKTKDFEVHLDRYGAKLECWPAEVAREARSLLIYSDDARRSYEAFLALESWIDASRPAVDSACAARVVASALKEVRARQARRPLFTLPRLPFVVPVPRLAFAALAATALGFAIGVFVGSPETTRTAAPHELPVLASAGDVLF